MTKLNHKLFVGVINKGVNKRIETKNTVVKLQKKLFNVTDGAKVYSGQDHA